MKFHWPDIKFINNIRKFFGQYILEKEWRTSKRDIRSISLDEAKNVGVMFNAKDEKHFESIKNLVKELKEQGKKVNALGFVPKTEHRDWFKSGEEFGFFTNEDFNWYFKPKGRKVVGFMSEPFDLLIDLRLKRSMPLLFIVSLSRATFKVGRFRKEYQEYYDLMMELPDDNENLDFFIEQMKHYLNMLKK